MIYLIIGLLLVGAIWLFSYLSGNPQFWHVAAKYPDEAFEWFMQDQCWIVVEPQGPPPTFPAGRSAYSGPFSHFVPKLGNRRVQVFGLADAIEESQNRFLEQLRASGKLPTDK